MTTAYKVTRNGNPFGCEYRSATEAAMTASTLQSLMPERGPFHWIACESDNILDELPPIRLEIAKDLI